MTATLADAASPTPASRRLAWAVMCVGALALVAIVGAASVAGGDGIGPLQRAAMLAAGAVIAGGALIGRPAVGRRFEPYAPAALGVVISAGVMAVGLAALEVYARSVGHYMPLATPLVKRVFSDKDRARLFNVNFVRQRPFRFGTYPEPPDTFTSDVLYPRFVFKPHVRLVPRGEHLVDAGPGEAAYWSTNNIGLRGPDIAPHKGSGIVRILCLGASTTEGTFNADDETYPRYLQRLLDESMPARFEVINAGISGADLRDLIGLFVTRLAPLEPDIVVFYEAHNNINFQEFVPGMACDLGVDCWVSGYPTPVSWLARRSAVVMTLVAAAARAGHVTPLPHRFDDRRAMTSLTQYEVSLRHLVDVIRMRGVQVVLSSFATLAHDGLQVNRRERPELYDDLVLRRFPLTPGEFARIYARFNHTAKTVADDCGVPFVDVAAAIERDPRNFPYDIIHFSAEGNRVLAAQMAGALQQRDQWPRPSSEAQCALPVS